MPALEKGSLILVSGANGYIASNVVDELLEAGYNVRGTVRDVAANAWLEELFSAKYGQGRLSLVQVKDFTQPGCFDEAVKGVQGFAHIASDLSFSPNPNDVVTNAIKSTQHALQAASTESGLQTFVLTSSSTAAVTPKPNKRFHISADSWNDEDVKKAWAPPPYERERAWAVYGASKMQSEQAAWAYVKEKQPHFSFNAILPNANFGKILNPDKQSASTAGWIRAIYGGPEQWTRVKGIPPQYYVHVRDTAKLHVVALTYPSIKNERILAFGEPYNWNQVLEICRRVKPDSNIPSNLDNDDKDLSTVDTKLALHMLKDRYGQDGFTPLEKGVTEVLAGHP